MNIPEHINDELLTLHETATVMRVPAATLRNRRHLGTGPRGFRLGRSLRYWHSDVIAWIEAEAASDESTSRTRIRMVDGRR